MGDVQHEQDRLNFLSYTWILVMFHFMNFYLKFPAQILICHALQLERLYPINYNLMYSNNVSKRGTIFLPSKFL